MNIRFELICGNRRPGYEVDGLPGYMGVKELRDWTFDKFPKGTKFFDAGEYATAFFTSSSGVKREIDIFVEHSQHDLI